MNNDLLRASSDPEIWKQAAAEINGVMSAIDFDAARKLPSATLTEKDAQTQRDLAFEAPRKLIYQIQQYQWGDKRLLFTYGQLDTEALLLLAERKQIGWQEIFNAKAAFGTPEDLENIARGALLAGSNLNLNTALGHAAKPVLYVQGLRHEGNLATTDKLFQMGADPNHDNNGTLFMNVVDQGRADIGRVFAKYGQHGLLNIESWVKWSREQRKLKLYEDLRKINWE
ncbi:MAG TPA: hypothetical protein VEF76_05400, partial [Patescibacteria group bacterium]|nr:hypothetical protein [Patescibacteria group bacterium]